MALSDSTAAEQAQPEEHGASVRAASRWLVTSYAALAALLVAGIQLKDVTSVTPAWRLWLALTAVLLALLATGFVIVFASRVLIAPALTWNDLVRRETEERTGQPTTKEEVFSEAPLKQDALLAELKAFTQIQAIQFTSPRSLRQQLADARQDLKASPSDGLQEQVQQLEQVAQACLQHANAWQSRQLYQQLIKVLWISGLVITACILLFLWVSRPLEEPAKVTKPFPVEIYIQGSTAALAKAQLNPACARQHLDGWAIDGDLNAPEVVTLPNGKCPASQFTVSDNVGVAVPKSSKSH